MKNSQSRKSIVAPPLTPANGAKGLEEPLLDADNYSEDFNRTMTPAKSRKGSTAIDKLLEVNDQNIQYSVKLEEGPKG